MKLSAIYSFTNGKSARNLPIGDFPIYGSTGIIGYSSQVLFNGENVLIARVGANCGFVQYVKGQYWVTDNTIVATCNEAILPRYGFYLLEMCGIHRLKIGAAQPLLTIGILNSIDVNIHSIKEQQHIVDTIGSVDDLIEKNEEIIEKAKAIIDQFYSSTIVEEKQSTLKDFFDITIGRTPPTKENRWFSLRRKENVCWLSIKDMAQNATFIFETSQYLTREAITKFRIPIVEEGDVLLSFKLTVGRTAIAGTKMVTNEAIACFKCKAEYRNYLLCYLQNCDFMSDGGNTSSIGKAINSTIIKNFPFAIPTDTSLNKFNNNTGPFFKLIKYKQRENVILKTQKERLLSKYFGSN